MKIIIRADGGSRIGMGHVMRMLVLADKLKAFSEVVFVCRNSEEYYPGINHIEACGYKVFKIDGTKLIDELSGIKGDCLITDSYDVDESYFRLTKNIFGITGYMDDLNICRIYADFIINQNIYAEELKYKSDEKTRLFLGTGYVLLRDEFRDLPRRSISEKIENVLITFGGADPGNLSEKTSLKLSRAFPDMCFHIAVGPSFLHRDSLRNIEGDNILLHYNPKMSELMLKCDAAVSACGGTVYELFACGTPVIGIAAADNQMLAARKMSSLRVLRYSKGINEVMTHLNSFDLETRARLSEAGQRLVDGMGSLRLAEQIRLILRK